MREREKRPERRRARDDGERRGMRKKEREREKDFSMRLASRVSLFLQCAMREKESGTIERQSAERAVFSDIARPG